jgi:hypothetical protein
MTSVRPLLVGKEKRRLSDFAGAGRYRQLEVPPGHVKNCSVDKCRGEGQIEGVRAATLYVHFM